MKLFSHRKGLRPVKTVAQLDSVDGDLRVALWNALCAFYWNRVKLWSGELSWDSDRNIYALCRSLWAHYFRLPTDTLPRRWREIYGEIRKYFFGCKWHEVYDFIEFVSSVYSEEVLNAGFQLQCNSVLEREVSAYRFVAGKISQITSEQEIAAVEETIQAPGGLGPPSIHISRALDFLVDRKAPDYRNSIKESISAVEATCKLLTGDPKAELHGALKELGKKIDLHPALEQAFVKMYAYTSDEHGIRHALLEEPDLTFEDAKFMLVSCCGFVNYLKSKSIKAGVKF